MKRASLALAAMLLVACKPAPGKRQVVKGTMIDVPDDPRFKLGGTVASDGYFYTTLFDDHEVRSRAVAGGPPKTLATTDGLEQMIHVSRDYVVFYQDYGKLGIQVVPKMGGRVETIPTRVKPSMVEALDDAVLWVESAGEDSDVVMATSPLSAKPAPREVVKVDGSVRSVIGHHDAFLVVVETKSEYVFDFYDRIGALRRTIYRTPRLPKVQYDSGDAIAVAVGTEHVFIGIDKNTELVAHTGPVVVVPRAGGPSVPFAKRVCFGFVALEDDLVYVAPHDGDTCSREFPMNQRLDLWRYGVAKDRSTNIYASFSGDLGVALAGGGALLLREHIQVPHEVGTMPKYDHRSTLFTP